MQNYHFRLKEIRTNNGLSQYEIAEKLEIKQPAWARLETGKIPDPRASTIIKICKTFNVSADWLLGLRNDIES